MKHIGLFEGIGGFSLAARWMGWETVAWCEWNEFGQRVLRHHFPEAEGFGDITKTNFTKYANRIDILTGGFPCQPYSAAGKRLGKEDDRHLWPEMLRAIREIQPTWVVGENVLGLVNWNGGLVFDEVQADLEAEGYEVQPYVLPAAGVGSCPHRRDRVWFVAYGKTNRLSRSKGTDKWQEYKQDNRSELWNPFNTDGQSGDAAHTDSMRLEQCENRTEMGGGQGKVGGEGSQPSNAVETNGEVSNASHSDCNGQHGSNSQHEVNASQGGQYAQRDIEQGNGNGDVADTDGIRLRGESNGFGKSRFTNEAGEIGNWHNFPTQSPICSRNDGLSSRLDGITFPKWRQESIKAAGNAIVPQVALQIFKTIQLYQS